MKTKNLRRYFSALHLYLGLVLGVAFTMLGLTGSFLVFYPEIDQLINPELQINQPKPNSDGLPAGLAARTLQPEARRCLLWIEGRGQCIYRGDCEEEDIQHGSRECWKNRPNNRASNHNRLDGHVQQKRWLDSLEYPGGWIGGWHEYKIRFRRERVGGYRHGPSKPTLH